jgi:hypothetical protein
VNVPKKKKKIAEVRAEATAKAEISAKASYQRKHTIQEVVPADVTRAKAGAWLDLISPITEWAGLKGDQLRNKRALFRIQQEETLLRIAESIRHKLKDQEVISPVPPKILVPALESASLENPSDDLMVDIWANLLANAASGEVVEPRYVGILKELSGRQAILLRQLATYNAGRFEFPYEPFSSSEYTLDFNDLVDDFLDKFPRDTTIELFELDGFLDEKLNIPASVVDLAYVDYLSGTREALDVSGTALNSIMDDRQSLYICLTLGLIARESDSIPGIFKGLQLHEPGVLRLSYFRLTLLGSTLIELCDPQALIMLKKSDWEASIETAVARNRRES